MLKPTGVLAICIDYRELFRLGQMLDELFGEQNRLGIINWQKSYAPARTTGHVSTATEYVLVYAKDEERGQDGAAPALRGRWTRATSQPGQRPAAVEVRRRERAEARRRIRAMVYAIQSPVHGRDSSTRRRAVAGATSRSRSSSWLEEWGCEYELKDLERRGEARGADRRCRVDEEPEGQGRSS